MDICKVDRFANAMPTFEVRNFGREREVGRQPTKGQGRLEKEERVRW